ncbi:hypothetical protein [Oceanirhabdus sp. W0125-5]|uniref:hypothetical protein n=1 Tax=Oceanirhabdus sp. W0125-5 TaxID=2999116 RepID=UPI0022F31C66|nr:hypothetical protein [Oceanirhabdus sp. W0125-5]WBW98854.1 hypothetical protein OW730_08960 [Oceanirhabdus sp. W0125-5]
MEKVKEEKFEVDKEQEQSQDDRIIKYEINNYSSKGLNSNISFGSGNIEIGWSKNHSERDNGYFTERKLSNEEINYSRKRFFYFDGYEDIKEYLANNNYVCLYENIDSGKLNISVNLLEELYLKDIIEINVDEEYYSEFFGEFEPREKTGYIFTSFDFGRYNSEELINFKIIKEKLKKISSAIVVLGNNNSKKTKFSNLKLFQCKLPENTEYILKKMLDLNLSDIFVCNEIIEYFRLDESKAEIRSSKVGIKSLEKIAIKIIEDWKEKEVCKTISEYLNFDEYENIKKWFLSIKSIKKLSYLLALSIFEGCHQKVIIDKAKYIEIILRDGIEVEEEEKLEKILYCDYDFWQSIKAEKKEDSPSILFAESSTRKNILKLISKDLFEIKNILLECISKWGNSYEITEIRAVGRAISELVYSKGDFNIIYDDIIYQWIKSDEFVKRLYGGVALCMILEKEEVFYHVMKLHRKWIKNFKEIGYKKQWVAIFMMGESLGLRAPEYSLKNLMKIYTDEYLGLKKHIVISLRKVFRHGVTDNEFYKGVLDFFVNEVRVGNSRERIEGTMELFLCLMVEEKARKKKSGEQISRVITILGSNGIGDRVRDIILMIAENPKFNGRLYEIFEKWRDESSREIRVRENINILIENMKIKSNRDNIDVIREIKRRFDMEAKNELSNKENCKL